MNNKLEENINKTAMLLLSSGANTAFTGAGISVESGIPPFRGKDGLWNKYDPTFIDINFFLRHPDKSWAQIKEIFYDFFGKAKYNKAHEVLARMEKNNLLNAVITQNIDNLHQEAGSVVVHEFHGNSQKLICTSCASIFDVRDIKVETLPPFCRKCDHVLKPDFIFFGEPIPQDAYLASIELANTSEVFIIIGSTGEVMPACQIPVLAKTNGAKIIEINTEKSNYTDRITDIFLQGKATEIMEKLEIALFKE